MRIRSVKTRRICLRRAVGGSQTAGGSTGAYMGRSQRSHKPTKGPIGPPRVGPIGPTGRLRVPSVPLGWSHRSLLSHPEVQMRKWLLRVRGKMALRENFRNVFFAIPLQMRAHGLRISSFISPRRDESPYGGPEPWNVHIWSFMMQALGD